MRSPVLEWTGSLALVLLTALLAMTGCGDDGDGKKTPYGSAAEVRAYRDQIDAVVDAANIVQDELDRTAIGSSGQATGQNLAAAATRLKPQVQAILERLERITPPPRLADLHARMRRLLQLRLEAFDQVIAGWEVEQTSSFAQAEPLYDQVEDKLAAANALAAQVNAELEQVDIALAEAEGQNPVA